MKTINRIAPLLIVIVLGISLCPRVYAVSDDDDKLIYAKKNKVKSNFIGIRIYPNTSDLLLFSNEQQNINETSSEALLYSQNEQDLNNAELNKKLETDKNNSHNSIIPDIDKRNSNCSGYQ